MSDRIKVGKVCPIPKGIWSQSNSYEKLNMVTKSGVLYIAKDDVPANTAITNTTYWMKASESLSIGTIETVSSSTNASATITDGENGPILNMSIPRGVTGNESIDDTKGEDDTDYVWSADKVYSELKNNENNTKAYIRTGNEAVVKHAEGAVASFNDSANGAYVKDLKVKIEPVQDLHGYDNPWPAGGGNNIWDEVWEVGQINASGQNSEGSGMIRSVNYISCLPETSYYFKSSSVSGGPKLFFYDSNKTFLSSITNLSRNSSFTTPASTAYMRFQEGSSYGATYNNDIAINYPSTVTTYSPYANICPISGHSTAVVTRTGKNFLGNINNSGTIYNVTFTVNDGVITADGTSNRGAETSYTVKDPLYLPAGTYSLNGIGANGSNTTPKKSLRATVFNKNNSVRSRNNDFGSGVNFTVYDGDYIKLQIFYDDGATFSPTTPIYPMVRLSSDTDSSYEAYQGTSVTISLGEERYGGELNVTTGVLTVTHAFQSGSDNVVTNMYNGSGTNKRFKIELSKKSSDLLLGSSNIFKFVHEIDRGPKYTCYCVDDTKNYYFDLPVSVASSVQEAQTFVNNNNLQIFYILATPFTVQLTPKQIETLRYKNHIFANTGDVSVDYCADTEMLFNDKGDSVIETVSGSIAAIDDSAENSPVKNLVVGIEPVQNLHGYDNPWPAGGGKNLLPMNVANIKTINTAGTWSGNVYTLYDVTYTLEVDDGNNVIGVKVNGTASGYSLFRLCNEITFSSQMKMNGCPASSYSSFNLQAYIGAGQTNPQDIGEGVTVPANTYSRIAIVVPSGVSVSNAMFYPMIRLSTESDATFVPYSNICPITGHTQAVVTRTGINIWDEEWELGGIDSSTGQNSNNNTLIRSKNYISCKPNTQYYFHVDNWGAQTNVPCRFYDYNKTYIGYSPKNNAQVSKNGVFTTPDNCFYMRFNTANHYGTTYLNDLSINYPSTDTDYHAGHVQTVTIDLDGTRYGGTLDVLTGELTVDSVSQTFTAVANSGETISNSATLINSNSGVKPAPSNASPIEGLLSSYLPTDYANHIYANNLNGIAIGNNGVLTIRIKDLSTKTAYNAYLTANPLQVIYPLATPVTVPLSANTLNLLKGKNNIWTSTGGDTTVTYHADTKMYIDKKFAELQALILENN